MRSVRPFALAVPISGAITAALWAQTPAPTKFDAAEVHVSAPNSFNAARGPFIAGGRYDLRNATMVELISKAYNVAADKIVDGPNWVEYTRYDIAAKIAPKTSAAAARTMLQNLLADRFGVVVKQEDKPVPAYVLTAPNGTSKLKEADGTGAAGCNMKLDAPRVPPPPPPPPGGAGAAPLPIAIAPTLDYTCKNMTMAAFAENLVGMTGAQQYIGTNPVQDRTGIDGKWDLNFKYSLPVNGAGAPGDQITIMDAIEKQLGMKLDKQTVTLPVVSIEKAVQTPTPNDADIAKKIPARPTEFELATIKPFTPPAPGGRGGIVILGARTLAGGRVEVSGLNLKQMVQQFYGQPSPLQEDQIVGAPKWMDDERWEIVARTAEADAASGPNPQTDPDALNIMMRALLADRFNLKAHYEDRPGVGYTLTAPKPKMKKADPTERSKWSDAQGNGGIISLNGGSVPSRTVKFQNFTMAQLAERLQTIASGYVRTAVKDNTGLDGGYDFSLTFALIPPAQLAQLMARAQSQAAAAVAAAGGTLPNADPIGGVTIVEAIDKQLGLKLVEEKRPVPHLVIDHIDPKPTEN